MSLGILRGLLASMLLLGSSGAVLAGGGPMAVQNSATEHYRMTYTARASFEEVKQYIVETIVNRGMVISNVSHIGDMLERTGKDLGNAEKVFLEAQALEFCSATVSRATMEADPHNIVFCPYIIALYVLPAEPETVYISFRRPTPVGTPESQESLRAVEDLLSSIIRDALQWL